MIWLRWAALAPVVGILALLAGCGSNTQPFNDTPTVANLFPSRATAGGPGFTLNVAGNGFIARSVAYWNNTQLPTTLNATTLQLSVSVPASDIATPGVAQITVFTPSPGGGTSNAVSFTINPPQNPVPAISSLSPSSTSVGALPPNSVLVVNGTNFVAASSVAFNGNQRTVTFVDSTQLSVPMVASDVTTNRTISVTVFNPAPGGGVSTAVSFVVGSGSALRRKASLLSTGAQFPQIVSLGALGDASNGQSVAPAVNADGRFVAFHSTATNLVVQGASGNIFVRDTCLGAANCTPQTKAVDLAPDGSAPTGGAEDQVAISGDGRFVAFASRANNLVPGFQPADPPQSNVYVRDLCTGASAAPGCVPRTQLVSAGAEGDAATASSVSPSISSDGRFIAFVSAISRLVSGELTSVRKVYVRDTCAGPTATSACVPATFDTMSESVGNQAAGPSISADGRYVAFEAWESDNQSGSQIVMRDTCLGADTPASCVPWFALISESGNGSPLAGVNHSASVSADGRFVAFESEVSGVIWLRDTCVDVSAPNKCVPSTLLVAEHARGPSVSSSGRYISFARADGPDVASLYVYDTCFGATSSCALRAYWLNGASAGSTASPFTADGSSTAALSSDDIFIVFSGSSVAGLSSSGSKEVLLTIVPF